MEDLDPGVDVLQLGADAILLVLEGGLSSLWVRSSQRDARGDEPLFVGCESFGEVGVVIVGL
ncbi:MAG: hypothetical protein ACRDRL_13450 [Sciscionella sp.]